MKRTLFYLCSLLQIQYNLAQELKDFETFYNEVISNVEIENNDSEEKLYQELNYLFHHPISSSEILQNLTKIPFLTGAECKGIEDYILKKGNLVSLYELNAIPILTKEKANWLKRIFTINENELHNYPTNATWTIASKNSQLKDDPSFYNFMFRQKLEIELDKNIQLGFHSENDPQEINFHKENSFDFSSFYFSIETKNTQLILGDFHVNYGQGLISWTGWSSYKNIGLSQIQKLNNGYSPYRSFDENKYYRGIAITKRFHQVELFGFFSRKSIDAKLNNDLGATQITSFPITGLHVTNNERSSRKKVSESSYSFGLEYAKNNWTFSPYAVLWKFPFQVKTDTIRVPNDRFIQYGINWNYFKEKTAVFQELNWSSESNFSSLIGLQNQIIGKSYLSILYKYIHPKYFQFKADYFSDMGNKPGQSVYLSLDFMKRKQIGKIYLEKSENWNKNKDGYRDKKIEFGIQFKTKLPYRGKLVALLKNEQKRVNNHEIQKSFKTSSYYHFNLKSTFQIRARLQWNQDLQFKFGDRTGWIYGTRFNFTIDNWKIKSGWGFFKQNMDAFYIYESEIIGISSFHGHFNTGNFGYLQLVKKIKHQIFNVKFYIQKADDSLVEKISLGVKLTI